MELQHHGFNGKLFDSLFFVVWLICMYRNGLLHQRETSTHKAAKSVGPHVYFQVGSPEFVPNGYMNYSCISLQSSTLAVVVFLLLISWYIRGFATTWQDGHAWRGRRGTITINLLLLLLYQYYYYISIMLQVKIKFRFNLLSWVDFEFP